MPPVTEISITTSRFAPARRRAVKLATDDRVQEGLLMPERPSALGIEPRAAGLDLAKWAEEMKPRLTEQLLKHRAILFRGFPVEGAAAFERIVAACSIGPMLEYVDRTTPRPAVGDKIYVSTVYPSEET